MGDFLSYKRSAAEKGRLKKLYRETRGRYGAGAYFDARKGRLIAYTVGSPCRKRALKRQCSKAVRRHKENLKHAKYKRTFDYFWELY